MYLLGVARMLRQLFHHIWSKKCKSISAHRLEEHDLDQQKDKRDQWIPSLYGFMNMGGTRPCKVMRTLVNLEACRRACTEACCWDHQVY